MSRILVTGGAGFIGSHLCEALLRDEHEVIALDNFDDFYDPAVKRGNLSAILDTRGFSLVEGDIRDAEAVGRVMAREPDVVVHLAARAGVRPSIDDPLAYADVNIRGTLVLLEAVRKLQACRFVFGGSSSVYGNRKDVPFKETDPVDDPISPYAATKKAGELLCHTYHHLYGLSITCLRFFTVYGPRQRPDLAIHKFARLMENDEALPVFGDGSMMRDFTYIDDIVDGIQRAIEHCRGFALYNLGESAPVSVCELISALEQAMGKKAKIAHKPLQPGDVERTFADVSLARSKLGYCPSTDLATGLARFVRWFRKDSAGA